jgi:hypothetical protein
MDIEGPYSWVASPGITEEFIADSHQLTQFAQCFLVLNEGPPSTLKYLLCYQPLVLTFSRAWHLEPLPNAVFH